MMQVAVVGPGRIGRGIAQAFLWAGHHVAIVDLKPRDPADAARVLDEARAEIGRGLDLLVSVGRIDAAQAAAMLARLTMHAAGDAAAGLGGAGIVIEGVPEIMAVKEAALGEASRLAPDAIIASATSTIMVDDLARFVERPERFLNAHFLNPAWLIPLVEVSAGAATSAGVLETLEAVLVAIGKVPVRCAPSPGFIVPRVQMLAGGEAIRLVEEGVASPEDVDKALRVGFALRFTVLGFLEFSDWGGLDIARYAGDYLAERLGGEHYRAPPMIDRLIDEGAKGMHSGRGFFDYRGRDLAEYQRGVTARLLDLIDHVGLFPPPFPETANR
ncbi:MAG: 3-hydroxyacyl-CoA dehydrogenase NAD-binding domain-containing protein [Sphingomonadales bacterium]